MKTTCLLFLYFQLLFVFAAINSDKMDEIPGYGDFNTSIYAGYLNVGNSSRQLHYVFVESVNGANNKDPLTLWLNGGPGCSSLLGFIQEIGPYYIEDGKQYKQGDNLTFNPHSWHTLSNLLFLESPAGVGFSYNTDTKYQYNDTNTAQDNYNALLDFFKNYPEYSMNNFWMAGQNYAGKYIPDLAVLINDGNLNNNTTKINIKGILIGNGVMDFTNRQLQKSSMEFMINRNFVDPELLSYWKISCQTDNDSAGCYYFYFSFDEHTSDLNFYNVYGKCFYDNSINVAGKKFKSQSQTLTDKLKQEFSNLYGKNTFANNSTLQQDEQNKKQSGFVPCSYFDGMYSYFNINADAYHPKWEGMDWNGPCAENITYKVDIAGSMDSYRKLLTNKLFSIVLYGGDWDAVVPYIDTVKNLKKLGLLSSFGRTPWFTNRQHSGFIQDFSGVIHITVKGGSHQVPQSKRAQALSIFKICVGGHQ